MVNKIWSNFKTKAKPILRVIKLENKKGTEDSLLLEGLKKILVIISGQNVENMTTLVTSLEKSLVKKDEISAAATAATAPTCFKMNALD